MKSTKHLNLHIISDIFRIARFQPPGWLLTCCPSVFLPIFFLPPYAPSIFTATLFSGHQGIIPGQIFIDQAAELPHISLIPGEPYSYYCPCGFGVRPVSRRRTRPSCTRMPNGFPAVARWTCPSRYQGFGRCCRCREPFRGIPPCFVLTRFPVMDRQP
jgi:hypothetical protein